MDNAQTQEFLTQAVVMAVRHVEAGGIPFAALVVNRDGVLMGSGVNRVAEDSDPTAHAEVVALRNAARNHGREALRGASLIASGEPCAMCYVSAVVAGIRHIAFAADRHDAAQAGFDYRHTYALLATPSRHLGLHVQHLEVSGATHPFELFIAGQE